MTKEKYEYEVLEQRIKELEKEVDGLNRVKDDMAAELNRLERILSVLNTGLSLINPDKTIAWVNDKVQEMFPSELPLGQTCYHFYEGRDTPCEICPTFQCFETGEICIEEKFNEKVEKWFRIISQPVKSENGEVMLVLEGITDVTHEKKIEEESKEKEEFSTILLENSPIPVIVVNPDTSIRYINPCLEKVTGYKSEDVLGRRAPYPWWTNNPMSGSADMLKDRVIKGVNKHERLFQKKNGDQFWVEVNATPIVRGGEIQYALVTWVDITERKEAEGALKESEERYRKMFEHAGFGIILHDVKTGERLAFNREAHEQLGYTRDEFRDIPHNRINEEEKIGNFKEHCKRIVEKGSDLYEAVLTTKDGKKVHHISSAVHIKLGGRDLIQIINLDITDRRRLEEQLRHSQKLESIGTLAGGVAHEFNNILGIIMGNSELAIDDIPEWSPAKECLHEIRSASVRGKDIVRQLMSFARKSRSEKTPMSMKLVIGETIKLMRASIPSNIEIKSTISCEFDTVLGDPTEISQILINLVTNARDAMGSNGGILEINLDNLILDSQQVNKIGDLEQGEYTRLTVRDTGFGMNQETSERIFDPFFTTKGLAEGTGMGLAVVDGIVKANRGNISFKSKQGVGTVFEVLLPCYKSQKKFAKGDDKKSLPRGSELVLLVDDEEALVRSYKLMLKGLGYDVIPCTDPVKALEIFGKQVDEIDLVITDMTMPGMTGDRLAMEIMAIRPDVSVILCTGYNDRMDAKRGTEMGIKAYIMKPILKKELARIIRKVLDDSKGE